jgi:hypothetical protein
MVNWSIASLKVAVTVVPVLTPVAPFTGEADDTVGGVVSVVCVVAEAVLE